MAGDNIERNSLVKGSKLKGGWSKSKPNEDMPAAPEKPGEDPFDISESTPDPYSTRTPSNRTGSNREDARGRIQTQANSGMYMENVDGADFQKQFRQLHVSAREATQTKQQSRRIEVAVNAISQKNENSTINDEIINYREQAWRRNEALEHRKQETEAHKPDHYPLETSVASGKEGFESAESYRDSSQPPEVEKGVAESPRRQETYQKNAAPAVSLSPANLPGDSMIDPKTVSKELESGTDPFKGIDSAQLGFVRYLFDKALVEIKNGNPDAASPYVERLGSISRTQDVIALLEDHIYDQKIAERISVLNRPDSTLALRLLDDLQAPRLAKYKRRMQQIISDLFSSFAIFYFNSGEYLEGFGVVSQLGALEAIWDDGSRHAIELQSIAGIRIRDQALKHLEDAEYSKAFALLHLFLDFEDHRAHKKAVCEIFASVYLKASNAYVDDINMHADIIWPNLFRVDRLLEIPRRWPGSTPVDVDLERWVLSSDTDSRANRKIVIDKTYIDPNAFVGTGLDKTILAEREDILFRVRYALESTVYILLNRLKFGPAYECLLYLEQFWPTEYLDLFLKKPIPADGLVSQVERVPSFKTKPTANMLVTWRFLRCRQRDFDIQILDRRARSLTQDLDPKMPVGTSLGFVFCLTQAELLYFDRRDLDQALSWCQKAMEFNDEGMPRWASKSDALYLLSRILIRKNMPLDADYYLSLIPSFEEYDEWRIYGTPGRKLQAIEVGAVISRGELRINGKGMMAIMDRVFKPMGDGTVDQLTRDLILRALYADDLSWSSEDLQYQPPRGAHWGASGKMLHFISMYGSLECLEIALHNPWINIEERDEFGKTPIHWAAKVFNLDKVKLLIQQGADIHAIDDNGDNVLHTMLGFTPKRMLETAEIVLTLNLFVNAFKDEDVTVGLSRRVYLLTARNKFGATPIDVMRSLLAQELETPQAQNKLGYLSRFADAWSVVSASRHCTQSYKDDAIFYKPAQREKELLLKAQRLARLKKQAEVMQAAETGISRERDQLLASSSGGSAKSGLVINRPRRVEAKPKEKKPKLFGIF